MDEYKQWVKGQHEKLGENRKRAEVGREELKRLPQDGRRFKPGDEVTYHRDPYRPYTSDRFDAVVLDSVHNSVKIELVGKSRTTASNLGMNLVFWDAPVHLVRKKPDLSKPIWVDRTAQAIVLIAIVFTLLVILASLVELAG